MATLQMLTANRLRDGDVVYWRAGGWVEAFSDGDVFSAEAEADAALDAARKSVAGNVVVNPYLFDVRTEANGVQPVMNDPLPPFTLGLLSPLVCLNLLSEQAAVNRDKKAFLQALHLDPLVSDFRTVPELAEELWAINEPHMTIGPESR